MIKQTWRQLQVKILTWAESLNKTYKQLFPEIEYISPTFDFNIKQIVNFTIEIRNNMDFSHSIKDIVNFDMEIK